jgi:hypothetical protein
MSLAAQCRDCKKVYNVGEHQAGKKFRCKACGGVIVVPGVAGTGAAPATKPANRPAAAAAPPAKRPAARASDSDDPFNNMDALLSLEASGTVQETPPPAAAPSRASGRRGAGAEDVEGAPPAPYRPQGPAKPLQYAGPARGPARVARAVNAVEESVVVDKVLPGILIGVGWGLPLVFGLVTAFMSPSPMGSLISVAIQQAVLFYVTLPIVTAGVQIGANNAQFDMTLNPKFRVLAIYCGMMIAAILVVVVSVFAGAAAAGSGKLGGLSPQNLVGFGLSVLGISVAAALGVGYVLFKFLFHCTWAQALLGFLMYVVFLILSFVALVIILVGIGFVLGGCLRMALG